MVKKRTSLHRKVTFSLAGTGDNRKDSDKSRIDENNYWKDRVDLLLYEKKNWIKDKRNMRNEVVSMKHKVDMMEQRLKHMQNVINRFGQYD